MGLSNGKDVQLLLLDCDGVLTDGGVTWSEAGIEQKTFNIRDGLGIKLWQRAGFQVGIVTGRSSQVVKWRATELSIDFVEQGIGDKVAAVSELITSCDLDWDSVAYIGDDLPDLPVFAGWLWCGSCRCLFKFRRHQTSRHGWRRKRGCTGNS